LASNKPLHAGSVRKATRLEVFSIGGGSLSNFDHSDSLHS